jgi:hypothetical protein
MNRRLSTTSSGSFRRKALRDTVATIPSTSPEKNFDVLFAEFLHGKNFYIERVLLRSPTHADALYYESKRVPTSHISSELHQLPLREVLVPQFMPGFSNKEYPFEIKMLGQSFS